MKVLHVIEAMHQGGAESLVIEHVRHAGPGVTSVVCALNRGGPALAHAAAAGARVHVLGKRAGDVPAGVRALAALMRAERIDVVNGHNPTGSLYAALAAGLGRVPVRVRTEHSVHYPGRHSRLYAWAEPWLTRRFQRVICVCEAVRASHEPRLPHGGGRFVTVANGIGPAPATPSRSAVRAALGWPEQVPVVLAVGSLTPHKDHAALLEALAIARASAPSLRVAIAGEGPLGAPLRARAEALGVAPAVAWLGARDDVAQLMVAADAFALPSRREGLSVTLLEAMRAGLPAVVSDVGGNAEAVVQGETGFVTPAADAAALAHALARLVSDADRARAMGAAAHARWAARFTAPRMVRDTEAVYVAAGAMRQPAPEGEHAVARA